jgi:hypothetical protein
MPILANETVPLTVTVTTAAAFLSGKHLDSPTILPITRFRFTKVYAGMVGLALLLLLQRRNQERWRPSFALTHANSGTVPALAGVAAVAIITIIIFTTAGCGGASTVATAPAITPTSQSQTYTITITPTAVTSTNIPIPNLQPIQLTLILD